MRSMKHSLLSILAYAELIVFQITLRSLSSGRFAMLPVPAAQSSLASPNQLAQSLHKRSL